MRYQILQILGPAFGDAMGILIMVVVQGGVFVWGVFMGRILLVELFQQPSATKVFFISMPIAVLVGSLAALYGFNFVVNPNETKNEALYDAVKTCVLVVVPLWFGCIWGLLRLPATKRFFKWFEDPGERL